MLYQRIINFLYSRLFRFFFRFSFKKFGKKSSVIFPLKIEGMKNISVGDNVYIAYKSSLSAMPLTGLESPILEIGDGTSIGNYNHIFATEKNNNRQKSTYCR